MDVEFLGAHAFTPRQITHRAKIKTRKHWMFSWITSSGTFKEDEFEDDQERLTEFYQNAGYIDFEVKGTNLIYPTPRTMRIEFVISEGNQYKVGTVTFKGNKIFTTDQIIAGLKAQHTFNRSKTKIGIHSLEDGCRHDLHAGRPDA